MNINKVLDSASGVEPEKKIIAASIARNKSDPNTSEQWNKVFMQLTIIFVFMHLNVYKGNVLSRVNVAGNRQYVQDPGRGIN